METMLKLELELETAISAAREAGGAILQFYPFEIVAEEKLGIDNYVEPVTAADKAASKIIVEGLKSVFPGDFILSEEEIDAPEKRTTHTRVWIIDPIDGTWGFIKKDGDFAVQIGLAEDGEPVLGVVFLPFYDTLYYATKGNGAFVLRGDEGPFRLHVSDNTDFSEIYLAVSRNHRSPKISRILEELGLKDEVQRGSVGLKIGLIAERVCDIYIHLSPRTKFWDTCGPQAFLEESGGVLTDLFGERFRYDIGDVQNYGGIVAANAAVHPLVIERLKPLLNEFGRHRVRARAR